MPNLITLETKLSQIQGVLPKFLAKLQKLGLETVRDLLWHFPTRYEDYSRVSKIADLKPGEQVTIRGEIKHVNVRRAWNKHLTVVEALIVDETGGVQMVWFNQPFIARALKAGSHANFAGKVFISPKGGISISNPSFEVLKGTSAPTHTAGIVPVYPETRGLTSKGFRYLIKTFLEIISRPEDFIPAHILEENHLPELSLALQKIHFPRLQEQIDRAKRRFAFEYLFLLQLNSIKTREQLAKEKAVALNVTPAEVEAILKKLPFALTESQKRSLDELIIDMNKGAPMNRLLQGDVGSGKTVIVAVAAVLAASKGKQAVFMAPTEVLARQHYHTITAIFEHLTCGIGILTGSEARIFYEKGLEEKKSKDQFIKDVESGSIKIIIGTHALISKSSRPKGEARSEGAAKLEASSSGYIKFSDLALVIIDEQHRFGVRQRATLVTKKHNREDHPPLPHFLSMSATPIPRTLSLAAFGDLDVSTINELPKGRKPIITKIVDPENRLKAYGFIRDQITAGRQAFFIYPRIEKSATEEIATDDEVVEIKKPRDEVRAVKVEYEKLSKTIFPKLNVAMLHGKMKTIEKHKVMTEFKAGKINILVSTSVIEVGVDIPNATIMVIEGADRFGLSQLYQFRGRVGRGEHQSFCLLFTNSNAQSTADRLNALLTAKNGFELAEMDLALRGPGEFLGSRQTGLPDAAMNAMNNAELIKAAQDSARALLADDPNISKYPLLKTKLDEVMRKVHLE
ncbi:MAG: ATP-dependent DNA helicase RecG [bacterium]|nr:ATP-dependent DNA helicase RecG [bacterium]